MSGEFRASKKKKKLCTTDTKPITIATQRYFAEKLGKSYSPEAWASLKTVEGIVSSTGSILGKTVAFPLPGGGFKGYLYEIEDREKRWVFTDGGNADLLVVGAEQEEIPLVEGEWDLLALLSQDYKSGATSTGGAMTFKESWASLFTEKKVPIIYDMDKAGREGTERAINVLVSVAKEIRNVRLPVQGTVDDKDLSDYLKTHNGEELRLLIEKTPLQEEKPTKMYQGLRPVSLNAFLAMELPRRENILDPWLPHQGLAMLHAYRGVGKTLVGLSIAFAVASGGEFLKWKAPKPCGVLYLDGEMPASVMQERLAQIIKATPYEPKAPFVLITPDLQKHGMPDLATEEGQEDINQLITDEIKLVVVDNLSCFVRTGKENEADSWQPVQTWALALRSRGVTVLFKHHSSKTGGQRGTSRREDVLDTVINLRRPVDYRYEDGAVFEVHFEKARGIYGDDVEPFEAKLQNSPDGVWEWTIRSVESSTYDRVTSLANDGLSQKEIAEELRLHKSNVSRHYRKAVAEGRIKVAGE